MSIRDLDEVSPWINEDFVDHHAGDIQTKGVAVFGLGIGTILRAEGRNALLRLFGARLGTRSRFAWPADWSGCGL